MTTWQDVLNARKRTDQAIVSYFKTTGEHWTTPEYTAELEQRLKDGTEYIDQRGERGQRKPSS